MWNLTYTNRVCNEHERFREHKTHLNKLLVAKTYLDLKTPYKPMFLNNKSNQTQNEINKNLKVDYENSNLLWKIKSIQKHDSELHPSKIIIKPCPAYKKTTFVKMTRQKQIDTENTVRFY